MEQNKSYGQYEGYKEKQQELARMLKEASGVVSGLNMSQFRDNLKKLGEKVDSETFKIQVVGTFKNGKSTFINSFLGEEVLPAYVLPCTAVINEVKYGKEKRAVVHFRQPLPEKLPEEIPDKAMRHMRQYSMRNIPPLEIPYDELEDYVVIPMGKDPKEMLLESPYEKIELFWPLDILEKGVEIIDSPGLNEHETRTRVTMDYLTKADAILFVLTTDAICSVDEMRFIENNLKAQGFEDPFFIVNKFDRLGSPKEKDAMRRFVQMKIGQYTSNEIFYVSARNALDGKIEGDWAKLEASGVAEFEKRLSDFLTKQKGKVKLAQPARELKRILNDEALFKVIPMQREMLQSTLDDVKKRYENVKPKLADQKMKKDQLYHRMILRIEQSKLEFRRIASRNVLDLASCIPVWVEEFEPASKLGVLPSKEKSEAVVNEIADYISQKMEEQQTNWRKTVLEPIVEQRSEDIFGSMESDLSRIFSDIDDINMEIAGRDYKVKSVPVWQRVAGALGGLAVGDIGLAASGGINGISKELAKTFAFEFGAGAVLGLLGLFNPVTLCAVLLGAFIYNWKKGQSNAMLKLKNAVSEELVGQLSGKAEENAETMSEGIAAKFTQIANQIIKALDIEIQETENQIKGIIAEMEKGREYVSAREGVIRACETRIKEMSRGLDNLIFQLVEG